MISSASSADGRYPLSTMPPSSSLLAHRTLTITGVPRHLFALRRWARAGLARAPDAMPEISQPIPGSCPAGGGEAGAQASIALVRWPACHVGGRGGVRAGPGQFLVRPRECAVVYCRPC